MIQPFLLVAAILWVAISEPPKYLWNYLLAQGVVNICLFTVVRFYPVESRQYHVTWAMCSTLLAASYFSLARQFLAKHPAKWMAIVCAAFLAICFGLVTIHGLPHPVRFPAWLGLAAGMVLVSTGAVLGVSAPYHFGRDRLVALTLGFLFLAQSLWQVGFVLHDSPAWDKANFVIPCLLCVGAWCWLGRRLRAK